MFFGDSASHEPMSIELLATDKTKTVRIQRPMKKKKAIPLAISLLLAGLFLSACGGANNHSELDPKVSLDRSEQWEETLDRVVKGVVVLRVTVTRDYDTEMSGAYVGTGFIVDAEKGIILTNRHLVQPGPVSAEAVFLNHEEVKIKAIYRDPVHDFGFYQYNPAEVEFAEVEEIELAPEAARVGVDIRVVGNDAGEKLSILSGTLARLDRGAPIYDSLTYNDFNTFYYQAASGTSGGSSGSPVINVEGKALALNAGGAFFAESSFFLPLHRVVRALELVQSEQQVQRGTIQTIFRHKPYNEIERLGLPNSLAANVRKERPDGVGMLVVDEVLPGGSGDGRLEPGDVLYTIDEQLITSFVELESIFDERVGESIVMSVVRGGARVEVSLPVGDLHAITPSEYIEVGATIIHPLSYQQARNFRVPVKGLYLARGGYFFGSAGIPWGAMIRTIDGNEVDSMQTLWQALTARPDRARMQVRYVMPFDEEEQLAVAYLDRRWFPLQWCRRDETGSWPCEQAPDAVSTWLPEAQTVTTPIEGKGLAKDLASSLIMVENHIPYLVEGLWGTHYVGTGVVLDTERGLVLTDRETVPVLMGDIQLTFGGSLRIPAEVAYVHPVHNFVVLSYDPKLIGETEVRAVALNKEGVQHGDELTLVGRDRSFNLVEAEAKVSSIEPLILGYPDYPAFRETNLDVVSVSGAPKTLGAILADDKGAMQAYWVSYGYDENAQPRFKGIPASVLAIVLDPLLDGQDPAYRSLGVELSTINFADARELGLSDERLSSLDAAGSDRRQALVVARRFEGFPAHSSLLGGDILLSVNGQALARFEQLEKASQAEEITLELLRDGKELSLTLATKELNGLGVSRALMWGGMLLHEPHLAVAMQRSVSTKGVYISWSYSGSPASHYGISPTLIIAAVNGVETPTLDALIDEVEQLPHGSSVRLSVIDLEGLESMLTFEVDQEYWPTWLLEYSDGEWSRNPVDVVENQAEP